MRVQLKPNYVLTDEHAAGSSGQPVLMNTETGEAFGPMDVFEPSESYGTMLARAAVKKMIRGKTFPPEEQKLIWKFVGLSDGG
jgi:hypothetical protein